MRCSTVKRELAALRDGQLTAERAAKVEAHLDQCESCRALDARYQGLDSALDALPLPELSEGFDAAFRQKLSAAREQKARESMMQKPARGFFSFARLAGATATLAAIVLTVVLVNRMPTSPPTSNGPGSVVAVTQSDVAVAEHLELLKNYEVVENLDALEDFDVIDNLDALEGGQDQ
jgi:anti-sigma factor RsiW